MRISDWSSDVCSSDLLAALQLLHDALGDFLADALLDGDELAHRVAGGLLRLAEIAGAGLDLAPRQIGAQQLVHLAQLQVVVGDDRSEEHTSELQSLMRISYAVFCLKKKNKHKRTQVEYN